MGRSCLFSLALSIGILTYIPSVSGQTQFRRFTRTPYYNGPNDPERGKIRGTLKLGETVIIDVPGDTGDTDKQGECTHKHIHGSLGSYLE